MQEVVKHLNIDIPYLEDRANQIKDRCNLLGISFEKNKFFVIDRDEKQNINFMDIEYQVKEFAEELNGKY